MCGIGGVKKFGEEPITPYHITSLAIGLATRGLDATGIALADDEDIHVLKNDVPAWKFVGSKSFKHFIKLHLTKDTHTVLVHTRAASAGKGTPRKVYNNHPMFDGETAIIHNGFIHNDDEIFKALGKVKRYAETDSDVIRAIVATHGMGKKGIRELNKLNGSVASAIISKREPRKLLLLRSGNPLVLGHLGELLFFASEKKAIHQATRPYRKWRNFAFQQGSSRVEFSPFPIDSAQLIGEEGLEWHGIFNSSTSNYTNNARSHWTHETYASRQRVIESGTAISHNTNISLVNPKKEISGGDFIECLNPLCNVLMELKGKQKTVSRDKLHCPRCKQSLAPLVM
jgi:asparagine synthetase B (glutamine-hydrolysing)